MAAKLAVVPSAGPAEGTSGTGAPIDLAGVSVVLGGIFFLEGLSVVTQVVSFKLTGKRIFLMAPIHHHYEKKGWPEPKIIVRFWIISILLALVSLASLKLR